MKSLILIIMCLAVLSAAIILFQRGNRSIVEPYAQSTTQNQTAAQPKKKPRAAHVRRRNWRFGAIVSARAELTDSFSEELQIDAEQRAKIDGLLKRLRADIDNVRLSASEKSVLDHGEEIIVADIQAQLAALMQTFTERVEAIVGDEAAKTVLQAVNDSKFVPSGTPQRVRWSFDSVTGDLEIGAASIEARELNPYVFRTSESGKLSDRELEETLRAARANIERLSYPFFDAATIFTRLQKQVRASRDAP